MNYRSVWRGVDLIYKGTVNELKYEPVVAAGADPSRIVFRYRGATAVTVGADGQLVVSTLAPAQGDALHSHRRSAGPPIRVDGAGQLAAGDRSMKVTDKEHEQQRENGNEKRTYTKPEVKECGKIEARLQFSPPPPPLRPPGR